MRRFAVLTGLALLSITPGFCPGVFAAESASYLLEEIPDGRGAAGRSEHFVLQGDVTWMENAPLTGINIHIASALLPFVAAIPETTNSDSVVTPPKENVSPSSQRQKRQGAASPKPGTLKAAPSPSPKPGTLKAAPSPSPKPGTLKAAPLPSPKQSERPSRASPVLPAKSSSPAPAKPPVSLSRQLIKIGPLRANTLSPSRAQAPAPSRVTRTAPVRQIARARISGTLLGIGGTVLGATVWFTAVFLAGTVVLRIVRMRSGISNARRRAGRACPPRARHRRRSFAALLALAILVAVLGNGVGVSAAQTTPSRHAYSGRLMGSNGVPLSSAHAIRFSYWRTADALTSDLTGTGAIHSGSAGFAGWSEVQVVTPDNAGFFTVVLGTIRPLPDFSILPAATLMNLHLQVEVKPINAPDTAYELLDPKPSDGALDRSPVLSVPFARNADLIDQREIGTGSGAIAILGVGGVHAVSTIPGGTNKETFTIDADNTSSDNVTLKFGQSLARTLTYNFNSNRFEFGSSVHVQGDLTVTGRVNGIDTSTLTGALTVQRTMQPTFEGVSYDADGSNNTGQLFVDHDATSKMNFYSWTSTRAALQDYDVVLRYTLSPRFLRWKTDDGANPLAFLYRSSLNGTTSNKMDIQVFDTAGQQVTLSGSTANLASTAWTNAQAEFSGTPTWTPGQAFVIRFKLSAKSNANMMLGNILLSAVESRP